MQPIHILIKEIDLRNAKPAVRDRILDSLLVLLPAGMTVNPTKMNVFSFAIQQLCKVEDPKNIDWLALTQLATNLVVFWDLGRMK